MRAMLVVVTALASSTACLPGAQKCASDTDCGASGVCEPVGFCSYLDPSCSNGRRFGDLAGSFARTCVGDLPFPDAGVDPDGGGGGNSDAGVDASGPGDQDGDGVADMTDNCPTVSNADQDNEDGDRFGDACDPCPPIAGDNPPDGDGDGVADACDPRPSMMGDSIVLFEGFHQGVPTGWNTSGTWTQVGHSLEVSSSGAQGTLYALSTLSATTGHDTVSASITVVSNAGNNNFAGVFDNNASGSTSSVSCSLYRTNLFTPTPGLIVAEGATNSTTTAYASAMTPNTTYIVRQRRDTPNYQCEAASGASSASVSETTNLANNPPYAGVYVTGATIRAHWLMIVANP